MKHAYVGATKLAKLLGLFHRIRTDTNIKINEYNQH